MFRELNSEELINHSMFLNGFVITKGFGEEKLIELATQLKQKKEAIDEIYWLNGDDPYNDASFDSIRLRPRVVVNNGNLKSNSSGLIFPQSVPIILVIANFNKLDSKNQQSYLDMIFNKEDTDRHPKNYLHKESIVILGLGVGDEYPKISYKLDVHCIV
jgi:hypothetical protein